MGCCSTAPRADLEINYETKEKNDDVEFENASDPHGEKLVANLKTFMSRKSKFHDAINTGIAEAILGFFGNGEDASALQIWGE